ncbi:MAG: HEAT repeat domain-containing protein [Rhodoglobus sp.]
MNKSPADGNIPEVDNAVANVAGLHVALTAASSSDRLQAALTAGTYPHPAYVGPLVQRCGIEPDFFVRDMLTWALTRHPKELTVPAVISHLSSVNSQARSQALHTLTKIGDLTAWSAISTDMVHDPDTGVARAAWRAAVILAPNTQKPTLAIELAGELGRGDRTTQQSLSRALIDLGETVPSVLEVAALSDNPAVRVHAAETLAMWDDAASE